MQKIITFFKKYWLNIIILIFLIFISTKFPLTGDDFGKGSTGLIEAFKNALLLWKNYNGRIFGNILVNLLNYNKIFKACLTALTIYGIIILLNKLKKNSSILSLCFIIIMLMPIPMFRESISWLSGFANFGIPALMLILLIYNFRSIFESECYFKWYHYIIAIICAIFMNLFSEHTSLFSVLIGIGYIIAAKINHKKIPKILYLYLLVSVIFCAIMFASPVYWKTMPRLENAGNFNNYNIFEKIYYNLKTSSWLKNIVCDNIIINILISCILLKDFKNSSLITKVINIILLLTCFIILPFISYEAFPIFTSKKIQILALIIYFTSITYLIIKKNNFSNIIKLMCYFLGAFIAALPLLIAYGIGPRCFLASYILFSVFLIELLNVENIELPKIIKVLNIIICFIIIGIYSYMYNENYQIFKQREEIISANQNNLVINLPIYKYPYLIHQTGTPPYGGYHYNAFKKYYHISENTYLKFANYKPLNIDLYEGFINTPSYDGSNETTHPNVIKVNNSKYKYWITLTPWPNNNNLYENPSILASHDGITWENPPEIINPISGIPKNKGDYYSDPYLYYDENKFTLIYRYNPYIYNKTISKTENNLILYKTSLDGYKWSNSKVLLDDGIEAYMSPSITINNDIKRIYYVNYDKNIYYKELNNSKWTEEKLLNVEGLNTKIWHAEMKTINNIYILLMFADDKLYIASSKDGKSFNNSKEIDISFLSLKKINSKVYNRVYKSSILFDEKTVNLYIPYNEKTLTKSTWSLYLKQYNLEDFNWLFEV